jgi:hypothetical protein
LHRLAWPHVSGRHSRDGGDPPTAATGFYFPNRAPLQSSPLMKLPIGSISAPGLL